MTIERRNPGDKRIPARDWNALAERHNAGMLGTNPGVDSPPRNPVIVLVKNNTGGDLQRRSIVGLGDSAIGVSGSAVQWKNEIVIDGETPEAGTHDNKFAVLKDSIADGMIGEAIVMGVTQVKLNVVSSGDTHAAIKDGETDYLETGSTGVEIIWKESGTGEKLGLVLLDRSSSPSGLFRRGGASLANPAGTNIGELLDHTVTVGCIYFDSSPATTQGGLQNPSGSDPFTNGTFECFIAGTYRFDFNMTMIKSRYGIPSGGPLAGPPAGTYGQVGNTGSSGTPAHTHTEYQPIDKDGTYGQINVYCLNAGTTTLSDEESIFNTSFGYSTDQCLIDIRATWYEDLTLGMKKYIRIELSSNNGGADTQHLYMPSVSGSYHNWGRILAARME